MVCSWYFGYFGYFGISVISVFGISVRLLPNNQPYVTYNHIIAYVTYNHIISYVNNITHINTHSNSNMEARSTMLIQLFKTSTVAASDAYTYTYIHN